MADDLRGRIAGAVMVVARMEARKEVLRRYQAQGRRLHDIPWPSKETAHLPLRPPPGPLSNGAPSKSYAHVRTGLLEQCEAYWMVRLVQ